MENQHKKTIGYRDLTQDEINVMNMIKEKGEEIEVLVNNLNQIKGIDKRWVSIGTTDLQTGMMALVRSVAKPTSF